MVNLKMLNTFVLAVILSLPVWGQLTSEEIDHLVEDAMEKFTVAGVAVGIVKDGEIIHAKGYGLKSVDTGEQVDEHTSFAIASNSKAFTTAAVALLVEEGKLNWIDRVIDHIPAPISTSLARQSGAKIVSSFSTKTQSAVCFIAASMPTLLLPA